MNKYIKMFEEFVNEDKDLNEAKSINKKGKLTKKDAFDKAKEQGIDFTKDSAQVDKGILADLAKRANYKKPKSASGSTGRYFFDHLKKMAEKQGWMNESNNESNIQEAINEKIKLINEEMSEKDVKKEFEEQILPMVVDEYGKNDIVAISTAFNDWIDGLHKDGQISDDLVDDITLEDSEIKKMVKNM